MGKYRETQCRLLSIVCLVCSCLWLSSAAKSLGFCWIAWQVCCGLVSLLLGVMLWDMSLLYPADSHSPWTMLLQYFIYKLMVFFGNKVNTGLQQLFSDLTQTQENLLQEIMKANSETVYGQVYKFGDITSREVFKKSHPLTDYMHYQEYIEKIKNGEQEILTKEKVIFLATTSGTTGKHKLIPITWHMKGITARRVGPLMYYMLQEKVGLTLQRVFVLSHKAPRQHTSCGIPCAPVSSHMSRYMPFVLAPAEAYEAQNEQVALFVHAVFSLREREVGHMEALVSTLVFSFWVFVNRNWQTICDAIELGRIRPENTADVNLASRLSTYLTADYERAKELRNIFKGYRGQEMIGIAIKVWPQFRFVRMLTTGGFAHHANVLRKTYMKGVVQISQAHAASEGFMGFNLNVDPNDVSYTVKADYAVMEFIQESNVEESQPKTLFVEQLQKGEKYEIVLTTPMGLYRYRTGDIIQVICYNGQCPVYNFLYRRGQLLNLYWEKTPENVFFHAVQNTVDKLNSDGITLVDFTSTENIFIDEINGETSDQKHYILFIEMSKAGESYILSEEECYAFDGNLCNLMDLYSELRLSGSIGCMRVVQLQTGTFQRLKNRQISESQNQQYKVPRVLRNKQLLHFLWSQQLKNVETFAY